MSATPETAAQTTRLLDRVRSDVHAAGAEAFLVSDPANVRYLSHFTSPEDAVVLITAERAWLITDSRYTVQAAEQSRLPVDIARPWLNRAAELSNGLRLAVEGHRLTIDQFRDLEKRTGREPIVTQSLLRPYRLIKSEQEVERLREAARITDIAFTHILDVLRPGISEVEVAMELERTMRNEGADGPSFGTIVASGLRSAMPHGAASQKAIEAGDLVTMDFGAVLDGYHADMTRAVGIGHVSDELRRLYDAVLEAQLAGVAAVAPAMAGRDIDAVARTSLAAHDLADAFGHSLGHGTGLEIHEGPSLSSNSQDVLEPGMIVTVEPGVYLPNVGGVRIEDLLVVTDTGNEILSHSPKHFIAV